MNIIRRNFPNLLTCLNILAGTVAIVLAFKSDAVFHGLAGWKWSILAIGVATVADFLDGFMARLLNAGSEMGKELDSLSDLVSFGMAPAMLLFNLLDHAPQAPHWLPWIALIIPVAGAVRLARFNVDPRQTSSFIGLPIPANAIFWLGFIALAYDMPTATWLCAPALIIPLTIIEAWLMLAPLPLFSLKFHDYKWRGNEVRWILIFASFGLICWLGLPALALIIILYLLLDLISIFISRQA